MFCGADVVSVGFAASPHPRERRCNKTVPIKLIKTTRNVTNFLDEEVFDIAVCIVEFCCLRRQR